MVLVASSKIVIRISRTERMAPERLHRRLISAELQKRRGWRCTSSEDGYVFVRPATGELPEGLGAEVRAEIKAINENYTPRTNIQFRQGERWIRVCTPETLAQAGRGEHRR